MRSLEKRIEMAVYDGILRMSISKELKLQIIKGMKVSSGYYGKLPGRKELIIIIPILEEGKIE